MKIKHCNPYLFGKQHHNRFKIGTKVHILEGYFTGLHGVVVGHKQGFDLLDERTGPSLKILIVNIAGVYEVINVAQWVVKLIDLHEVLPFAIPLRPRDTTESEREAKRVKRK